MASSAATGRILAGSRLVLLQLCVCVALHEIAGPASAAELQWKQVWADEFNYTGAPDSTKWGYEIGKIRNNEAQYYTNRLDNASVANGVLTITAKKESYQGASYTSASLQTMTDDHSAAKFSNVGGRLEMRAKVPASKGAWPAFWTMGTNVWSTDPWPKGGEIDVMEYVANDPYVVYGSLHYLGADGIHKATTAAFDPRRDNLNAPPIASDFHVFRVDWYADRIEWYVDDKKYNTIVLDGQQMSGTPFTAPHYLILNFALGGNWGGAIDPNFMSDQFVVDYVRVSKLVPVPEPGALLPLGAAGALLLTRRIRRMDASTC